MCLLLFVTAYRRDDSHSPPLVRIRNGTLSGIHDSTLKQDLFLGIPYAQPPVGTNRFRQSMPYNEAWVGIREAVEQTYACPSYPTPDSIKLTQRHPINIEAPGQSEDCLTLSIGRPSNAKNLPVAVWFHGGAFQWGTGASNGINLRRFLNASVLASKPLIIVTVSYRLNYFGFLAGKDLYEEGNTNLGLHDQRRALHWIQENIAAFGGDPRKVTIFGQSAYGLCKLRCANCRGAKSVAAQMFAFNGRDDHLFRGAILESGAPATGIYWPAMSDYSQAHYELIVSRAGCSTAEDKLACLRSLEFTTLYDAMEPTDDFTLPFFLPSIDGDFIAESPSQQLMKGNYVKVPMIQGQNDDEGAMFTARANSNSDEETRQWFLGMPLQEAS